MNIPVRQLLEKLDQSDQPGKVKASSDKCITDFMQHIQWLKSRHVRKNYSNEYLVSTCFGKSRIFQKDCEAMAFCRAHLAIAVERFELLIKEMKGDQSSLSFQTLIRNKETIRDYLFDLKNIAEFLEKKKNPSYSFFEGWKAYGIDSLWIFHLSKQLANQRLLQQEKLFWFDHKGSQIASVFVLRQALEAKFSRIIGVNIFGERGQTPKLRHTFHYDFIDSNPHFFEFVSVEFKLLKRVYEWCNEIVHKVFQPYAWQIDYAHSICTGLFSSGDLSSKGGWSIHGGVRILDLQAMQSAFETHFCDSYDHGIWCLEYYKPEAVSDFYK